MRACAAAARRRPRARSVPLVAGSPAPEAPTLRQVLHTDHTSPESTPSTRTRRAEIDDFLRLLEAARARIDSDSPFALALLAPRRAAPEGGDGECCREADLRGEGRAADALADAHGFLAQNLRRVDEVAFYGPTLLAALLPAGGARRPADDLARLLTEFQDTHPHARLAAGLASFPGDGAEIEALVDHAEAALTREAGDDRTDESFARESAAPESAAPGPSAALGDDGHGARAGDDAAAAGQGRPAQEFLPLDESGAPSPSEWRVGAQSHEDDQQQQQSRAASRRGLPAALSQRRALRESKRGDDFEASVLPSFADAAASGVLARAAAEAAARERERRAAGESMPRRILLAVSDAARMAQVNLLLRSAGYEVRAAFDGGQALDLLRIERADLLVLDFAVAGVDGLEVLRRLDERNGGRPPLPVVLLVPAERDGEELRGPAAQLGAGGFVPLPYDPQELLDCVRTAGGAG